MKPTARQQHFTDGAVQSRRPGNPPASSWWCGVDRDELDRRAEAARHRMANSLFGVVLGAGFVTPLERETKLAVRAKRQVEERPLDL